MGPQTDSLKFTVEKSEVENPEEINIKRFPEQFTYARLSPGNGSLPRPCCGSLPELLSYRELFPRQCNGISNNAHLKVILGLQ